MFRLFSVLRTLIRISCEYVDWSLEFKVSVGRGEILVVIGFEDFVVIFIWVRKFFRCVG